MSEKLHFSKGVNPCFWSKMHFFCHLFLLKIRLEIGFNYVLERKETYFEYKNKIVEILKNRIFPKGLTHIKKCEIFLYLDLVKFQFFLNFFAFKTGLETMFNNVLERKESCFCVKKLQKG